MNRKKRAPALLLALLFILSGCGVQAEPETSKAVRETEAAQTLPPDLNRAELAIWTFSQENAMDPDVYPERLVALLERNPDAEEFVLYYPLEYGKEREVDLSAYKDCAGVPLFMQWDRQWGYMEYGLDLAGLTACGPVCLSMVAYYYLRDDGVSPDNVMRFAVENGYCAPGDGSYWSLIYEGGEELGLEVTQLDVEKTAVMAHLEAGEPVICIMGPGDFTASGHFIVMVGVEDGAIRINDPNSYHNSRKLWDFDAICGQIRGLWAVGYAG